MNQIDEACKDILAACALCAQGGHHNAAANHIRLVCLSKNCRRSAEDAALLCNVHMNEGAVKTHVLERLMEHKAHRDALKAIGVVLPKRNKVFDTAKERSDSSSSSESSSESESDSEVASEVASASEDESSSSSEDDKVRCSATAKSTGLRCEKKTDHKSGKCHHHRKDSKKKETKKKAGTCSGKNKKTGEACGNKTTDKSGKCFHHRK